MRDPDICSVYENAADTPEKPAADRSVRIVVQRLMRLPLCIDAFPGLQDARSALLHGIKPPRCLLLQQQPVRRIRVSIITQNLA